MENNQQVIKKIIDEIIDVSEKQKRVAIELINKRCYLRFRGYISFGRIYIPEEIGIMKQMIEKNSFFQMQSEAFWILYKNVYEIIEKTISRFGLRSLLDICYSKIIYFSRLGEKKQKEIAVKNFLYNIGFILSNGTNPKRKNYEKDYEILILELSKESDRKYFNNLKKRKFPIINQRLWPGLSNDYLWKTISKDLGSFFRGKSSTDGERGELIKNLYCWLSLLLHGDFILLRNLDLEKENGGHLFSAYIILLLTGIQVLEITDEFLSIKTDEIKKIREKIKDDSAIIMNLRKI